jgi:hypothetical protein
MKDFAVMAALVLIASAADARSACDVLSKKDVAAVQGEAFTSTKLTEPKDGGLPMSQCFYQLPIFSKSLSVVVMTGTSEAVREYWNTRFEHEEEGKPPKEIEGVGDDALWSGNAKAGALYVLRRNVILRISVGGADSEERKIAKSKKLARMALKKL